jgi:hypothetical protein
MARQSTRIIWLLGIIALAGGPAFAGPLGDLAGTIDHPRIGQPLRIGGPLTVGHAVFEVGDGTAVRELLAGDRRCGVAIDGRATMTYTVDDPISMPVAKRNLKRASKLDPKETEGHITVTATIGGAVIWGWQIGNELSPAGDPDGTSTPLPKWAAEILADPFFSPPSHDLLAADLSGDDSVAYALIDHSNEPLLLSVDPAVAKTETLFAVERQDDVMSVNHGRHWLDELAATPIGRAWWDRFPAPLVAVQESIRVVNDTDEHVTVSTTSTLQATRNGVGLWRTRLLQQRVKNDKILPNTVMSVKVDGRPADFVHSSSELLVAIVPPVKAGQKIVVEVVNEGRIALQPGGDQYWSLGTWAWYPQPDWNGEFATVEMELKVPEEWHPFASGNRVSFETKDGFSTLKTALDRPTQFPVMAAGKYHVYEHEQNGVNCRVASYVFGKKSASERLAANFFAAADFYGALFGVPYPFEDMDVVEVNDWGFGQAPAGVLFITQEAFQPIGDYLDELFSKGVNERYVHEVAHTWWGSIVKQDSPEEQWIAEGFAEYSAGLCLEAMRGGGRKGEKEMKLLIDGWKARARSLGDGSSLYLANHLAFHDAKDRVDRWRLMYTKGPLVVHAIRLRLREIYGSDKEGDRQFVVFLSAVVKNFTFKWATTRDLIGILSQMTGQDWQPFFDRYVFGTEMPEV